jgi:uncharacterized membrane protein HdeD (DUF308 family)
MRGLAVLGIVLLLGGLGALIWPAITYTKTEKAIDIGPIEVQTQRKERIPLSPIVGIAAIAAGVTLLVAGRRRSV